MSTQTTQVTVPFTESAPPFMMCGEVMERYDIAEVTFRKLSEYLLAQTIGTDDTSQYRYSRRYVDAAHQYGERQNIPGVVTQFREFAGTQEGQDLAHGIRAEHRDDLQRSGTYLTARLAELACGFSLGRLQRGGFTAKGPSGRAHVIPTEQLIQRQHWRHPGFTEAAIEPRPIEFCKVSDAANILDTSKYSVHDMLNAGLIASWSMAAALKDPGRNRRATARYLPLPYVLRLVQGVGARSGDEQLMHLAHLFHRDHPTLSTQVRGHYEAYVNKLRAEGAITSLKDVAAVLGLNDQYFYKYELMTPEQALASVRWAQLSLPIMPRSKGRPVEERVKEAIVQQAREPGWNQVQIAAKYGVSSSFVQSLLSRVVPGGYYT